MRRIVLGQSLAHWLVVRAGFAVATWRGPARAPAAGGGRCAGTRRRHPGGVRGLGLRHRRSGADRHRGLQIEWNKLHQRLVAASRHDGAVLAGLDDDALAEAAGHRRRRRGLPARGAGRRLARRPGRPGRPRARPDDASSTARSASTSARARPWWRAIDGGAARGDAAAGLLRLLERSRWPALLGGGGFFAHQHLIVDFLRRDNREGLASHLDAALAGGDDGVLANLLYCAGCAPTWRRAAPSGWPRSGPRRRGRHHHDREPGPHRRPRPRSSSWRA
ncbi:MAG: hypothetical protein HS111_23375 [Kofleriaceae bacterium]|nr:hypothetical protein [Kofleriaceae bacterium]